MHWQLLQAANGRSSSKAVADMWQCCVCSSVYTGERIAWAISLKHQKDCQMPHQVQQRLAEAADCYQLLLVAATAALARRGSLFGPAKLAC